MFQKTGEIKELLARKTRELQNCRAILLKTPHGILIVDKGGSIRFANSAAGRMLGCLPEELVGMPFQFPLSTEEKAEITLKSRDGKEVAAEVWVVETEWEEHAALFVSLHDITGRRCSEQELRKLYRAITDSPSIVMITDNRGNIEYVNPKFTEITGYTLTEVAGKNPALLKSGEMNPDELRRMWETISSGDEWHGEFINRKKNGEIYLERASISPVKELDGVITHFVAVKEDVTEQKRIERELRESEALLNVIFDEASQLMGLMKPDGTLIKINRTAFEFIQGRADEVLGRPFWETPWWTHSKDMQDRVHGAVEAAARGEFVRFEATHRTPEGELVWVDFSLKPVKDAKGDVVFLVPEGRDITPYKQAAEEIEILHTDLAARAHDLEIANQELEAFSYTVSHDLRAPLTTISASSQMVVEMCGQRLNEQCRELTGIIEEEVGRMDQLIGTLLDFARITRSEVHRETVDISIMAETILLGLRQREPDRKVVYEVAEGLTVSADPKLLRVALENLLGNAWKYTAKRETAIIRFGLTEYRGRPAYYVEDNGIGFAPKENERVFIPFQRVSPEEFTGTGIGLATVHRIIQRHGGRIWAEGEEGKGATFYFTL
ncbi:PAS domain S-box protein [Geobacter sp. DSM 9736]|uniref:PAS domain S-box protein n=1 Tax=Geobacter sp. DSM 9736 TaxID=1277350 RepID=UPI000B4FE39A|nr:PAS domain S-box protein [Geobacter sp. DSM 9736]SNB44721.1 PAS domain S-box-containing protein [Geobacter sp. DSM 9736]